MDGCPVPNLISWQQLLFPVRPLGQRVSGPHCVPILFPLIVHARSVFRSIEATYTLMGRPSDVTYPGADRRSTSGPSGPSTLPTLIFGGPSTAEREVARQRRRAVQDSRRQTKVRTRRTRLPSTWDAGSSEAREVGHSIDSLIASSVSSYDMGSSIGGAHYSRPESISSAQIPYLGGVPS